MEDALPERVAQDDQGRSAGDVLRSGELAAELGRDAEHAEVAGGDALLLDEFEPAFAREVDAGDARPGRHIERVNLVADRLEARAVLRIVDVLHAVVAHDGSHEAEASGFGVGNRPEQDGIEDAIYSGVDADAKPQRGKDNGGERRSLAELAQGEAEVVPEGHAGN